MLYQPDIQKTAEDLARSIQKEVTRDGIAALICYDPKEPGKHPLPYAVRLDLAKEEDLQCAIGQVLPEI